ncbi:MAG TPA: hypothetical protein VJK02_07955 [Anaerolineales bacterium]|nr:hypothetical protein [Anaerolineales bacterium]
MADAMGERGAGIPDSEQVLISGEDSASSRNAIPESSLRSMFRRLRKVSAPALLLSTFILGLTSGYLFWGRSPAGEGELAAAPAPGSVSLSDQINSPEGYTLPVSFGEIGPQLLAAGAIDLAGFVRLFEQAGTPLTDEQLAVLTRGSEEPIVIRADNALRLRRWRAPVSSASG